MSVLGWSGSTTGTGHSVRTLTMLARVALSSTFSALWRVASAYLSQGRPFRTFDRLMALGRYLTVASMTVFPVLCTFPQTCSSRRIFADSAVGAKR